MEFPQQFGKYTLLKKLATGGMAEIFLARQAGMGGFEKDVVVKRLLPEHAANQELVSMFLDEARIAANLTHPNIAQIFDLGTQGDAYYIAMEYVHGVDLRRLCSQGIAEGNYLPVNHAVRIIAEVCDSLAYAHARTDDQGRPLGIVHRDVSPTNVLVTFEGGVKLVDFGIAKAANKVSVTRAGQIKGKFGYMSPEQVRGGDIDARSDIFAVGINLYEITLGRRLFRGDSELETMRAIEECSIQRPREVDPNYPESLERIVMRALARDPGDRYASARDVQMALEDYLAEAGLRSTAGMLAEYMRHLFREQLEIEAQEAPALRALARSFVAAEPEVADAPEARPAAPPHGGTTPTLDADTVLRDRDAVVTRLPVGDRTRERPPATPAVAAPPSAPPVAPLSAPPIAAPPSAPPVAPPQPTPRVAPGVAPDGGTPMWRPAEDFDPLAAETPIAHLDHEAQVASPARTTHDPAADFEARLRRPRRFGALLVLLCVAGAVAAVVYYLDAKNEGPLGDSIGRALTAKAPVSEAAAAPATEPPPVRPAPRQAVLRLSSTPPGARVVVNGNVLEGVTPTTVQSFAGHTATVRMLLQGYVPAEQRVDVGESGADVNVPLTKGVPQSASLRVESEPPGARVALNGTDVGVTPVVLPRVAAGTELSMRLTRDGAYPHVVVFSAAPGEAREIGVQLIPDTGPRDFVVVNVETFPGGASVGEVLEGGTLEKLGKTGKYPLKLKNRPYGSPLRLRAELPGYVVAERDVDLRDAYYTVHLRLAEAEKFYGALDLDGPAGLTVYVGPKEIGKTPLKDAKLPEGEHQVVVFDEKTRARGEVAIRIERDQKVVRTVASDGAALKIQ